MSNGQKDPLFWGDSIVGLTPLNADVHVFCLLFDGKNDPNE